MKYALIALIFASSIAAAEDVYVQGHMRNDGTYVAPHHRSAPDSSPYNNYGAQGNINPYSGQQGYQQPNPYQGYQQPQQNAYDVRRSSYCQPGQRC
jgi:hypothetical protein